MGTKVYDNFADLITFTRASGGTALRRIGYGTELVTNGTFDTDSDWAKGTGWTISGGAAIANIPSGFASIAQSGRGMLAGRAYRISFEITSYVSGSISLQAGSNGMAGTINTGAKSAVGVYTVVGVFPAGQSDAIFARAEPSFVGSIDNVSVKEVLFDRASDPLVLFNHPNNVPRIEYDASGAVKGLLIEEARTNRFAQSASFSDWTTVRSTLSDNTDGVVAPDGTVSKILVCDTSPANSHALQKNTVTAAANSIACASIFVRAQPSSIVSHLQLRLTDDAAGAAYIYAVMFNLATGEVTATGAAGTLTAPFNFSESLGNGWYRIGLGFTKGNTNVRTDLQLAMSDVGTMSGVSLSNFNGDGTSGVYIHGVQLEEGAFPTSYIPTAGATATRAADIASIPTSAFGYNRRAGTVVATFQAINTSSEQQYILGSNTGLARWCYSNPGDTTLYTYDGFTSATAAGFTAGAEHTAAFGSTLSEQFIVLNGGTVGTAVTSGNILSLTAEFGIGWQTNSPASHLNGHIRSIAYYPRRLLNTQLQELTA